MHRCRSKKRLPSHPQGTVTNSCWSEQQTWHPQMCSPLPLKKGTKIKIKHLHLFKSEKYHARKLKICMQKLGYSWKLFIFECGAVREGVGNWNPDMTVLCVDPATVATVTVWLTAVWFGFWSCAFFGTWLMCKNVRVRMHAHTWGWKIIKRWDDRRDKGAGGISSAQERRGTLPSSLTVGAFVSSSASVLIMTPTLR